MDAAQIRPTNRLKNKDGRTRPLKLEMRPLRGQTIVALLQMENAIQNKQGTGTVVYKFPYGNF